MKKFNNISDVGRGRLLFRTEIADQSDELYLATTNEYILCSRGKEIILPSQEKAIEWAILNRACSNKRAFLERCVDAVRIPYAKVIPQLRLYFDEPDQSKYFPIDPNLRMAELIQHPIYNNCVIKHDNSEQLITLSTAQRHDVLHMSQRIFEVDYYCGDKVDLTDGLHLEYSDNEQYAQMFHISGFFQHYDIESFCVFTGTNLPSDFRNRNIDEATWLRIVDSSEVLSHGKLLELALISIAVCLHYQINYEFAYAPDIYPFTVLQDLGLLPYEPHPDLYY